MRNTIQHRGDATGGREEELLLAPDAASGLSGFSGGEIGWRSCSSDLTVLKSWSRVSSAAFVFFYHLSSHSGLARALVSLEEKDRFESKYNLLFLSPPLEYNHKGELRSVATPTPSFNSVRK